MAHAFLTRLLGYLYDEASTVLDTSTDRQIGGGRRRLTAGCSSITIADRVWVLQDLDKIALQPGGRIVE